MADSVTRLPGFLAAATRRRFVRGEHDCALFLADWVRTLTGTDPAAAWRGTYRNSAEATALMAANGGLVAMVDAALAGWTRTTAPIAGDVAVAQPAGHDELAAGVVVKPGKVALLTVRGLVIGPMPLLAAWTRAHA